MINIKIKLYSFDNKQLYYFLLLIKRILLLLNFKVIGPILLPIKYLKFNVLKSPNADKDFRYQLGIKNYSGMIYFNTNNIIIIILLMGINISSMINVNLTIK